MGTTVSGSISPAKDVDWYSFTLESPSWVTIQTTGSTDTEGELYNSAGIRLESDGNDGAGNNFRIHRYLDAGTYYISVAGRYSYTTGEYELSVAGVSATAVTVGIPVSGSISAAGEVDLYSFTLVSPSFVTIQTTGSTYGRLYDSAGISLEHPTNEGDRFLGAGTYYISVGGDTNANYSLSVTYAATAVTLGTTVSGSISERREVDWYSFTLASPSAVTIETTGSTDTVGRLYNSAGIRLETDDNGGTGNNFWIERDLVAGTYYIRVAGRYSSTTGGYSLSVVTTTQAAASGVPTVTYNEDVKQIQRILDLPVTTSGTAYNEDVELTAAIGSVADVNGIDSSSLQWQWYSAPAPTSGTPADNDYTAITGATAATFTPLQANVGQYIRPASASPMA